MFLCLWFACSSTPTEPAPQPAPAPAPAPQPERPRPFDVSHKEGLFDKSLCIEGEIAAWSCDLGQRMVSICASRDLGPDRGYVQYRIGRKGDVELEYPAERVHPRGRFAHNVAANGDEDISFENGGYEYIVFEILRDDKDGVIVRKDGKEASRLTCNGGSDFYPLSEALK